MMLIWLRLLHSWRSSLARLVKHLIKASILFLFGGIFYYMTEIIVRGYSHWTMFIAGGLIFLLIGIENQRIRWEWALTSQMFLSCLTITICEFITGLIVNVWLGLDVWSYADKPYNLLGQICLLNSVLWFFYSLIGILADDYLRYWLFKEEKPHYKIL